MMSTVVVHLVQAIIHRANVLARGARPSHNLTAAWGKSAPKFDLKTTKTTKTTKTGAAMVLADVGSNTQSSQVIADWICNKGQRPFGIPANNSEMKDVMQLPHILFIKNTASPADR